MKPQHINATRADLEGNKGLGRYILMTGSDQRAQQISEQFANVAIKKHPRQHNLYLGTITTQYGFIEVGSISSGMGGASADIIINELIMLGISRILRVGTAGSLQPARIKTGNLVIATSAVRDDKSSWDYIYPEYPAVSSLEYLIAALRATKQLHLTDNTHMGLIHSKSSLYARELGLSFSSAGKQYINVLKKAGVLATEMECAQLFTLSSLMSGREKNKKILAGAILAIIGDEIPFSADLNIIDHTIKSIILVSLETTRQLSYIDNGQVRLY